MGRLHPKAFDREGGASIPEKRTTQLGRTNAEQAEEEEDMNTPIGMSQHNICS